MPVSRFLDYEHFCELCELIHFDLEDAWPVWRKLCGLLGQEKMDCGAFGRGMSYAWPIKDLSSLRASVGEGCRGFQWFSPLISS